MLGMFFWDSVKHFERCSVEPAFDSIASNPAFFFVVDFVAKSA